jgi:signal-transduction protein with cAMP-binding, CBS, and nucleotidyltransferase domain
MIRELVNSTISIANKNFTDYKSGKITEESAKSDAIDKIRGLRYGMEEKDYFFITDMHPNMIMHPYRSDLNGTDLSTFKDPNGKALFREMVHQVKIAGDGFVDYKWQWMDDSSNIVPKISYVREFKPWGWVIGTGIYIEDIREKITAIERELIIVSIAISGIISILLTIIVFQNLKTEIKRSKAESELLVSEEKYKTLVEASTEGTAMVIDGELIYSNKIFQDMFPKIQLENSSHELKDIINIDNVDDLQKIVTFIKSELSYLQFETEIYLFDNKRTNILLSLSKISLNDKDGLIIIIKELSGETSRISEKNKWAINLIELLQETNRGMFKIAISDNGRFVDMNDHAVQIMNYASKHDFLKINIIDIVENKHDWLLFLKTIKIEGHVTGYHLKVRKNNGELSTLLIDAKFDIETEDNKEYVNGIFTDISEQIKIDELKDAANGEIQSSFLHLNQELKFLKKETISCNMNLSAKNAALLMSRNNTDVILIRSSEGDPVGIVTDADIRLRLISSELNSETQIYEIMSSPVYSLSESSTLSEAIIKMEEKGIHHIIVKNGKNEISGIIGIDEILKNQYSSSHLLIESIRNANSIVELRDIYKRLPFFVNSAIQGGIKSDFIIRTISIIAGEITRRISELIFLEIGEPPVTYAFVSLGSEGREEQTLVTDQDNAIIFEDVDEKRYAEVEEYFARFAERMNYMLDAVGYSYCKGGIMANNPKWNKPLSIWKGYFKEWITNPEPQNLLEIAVFFDMKTSFGRDSIVNELLSYVSTVLKDNSAFFGMLARVGITYKTQLNIFGKIQTESTEEHSKSVNVKNALRVVVNLVRLYAMKYNLSETNTSKRLKVLFEMNVISGSLFKDLVFSYDFLSVLQLKAQVNSILHQTKPDNFIDLSDLSSVEINSLKNIFSQVSVFQSKLKYDFGLTE